MTFVIKSDGREPFRMEARDAWDALKLVVNGHLNRRPGIEGDFHVEHGVITAAIWRTGHMYHIRPLRPARCVCGEPMSNGHECQQQLP